ncbi:sodium- and chloride-dependent GABA transporter 2-like [Clupea harengus]|uniref:Sodium- and chloride-dependent GABA transporter 2-like n=1 Tax=Clupea harengus TaxID=7950 RepID=A0A8M1KPX1_CLUHA|nr:sodium- and chloride-dependent GABA transporter 2-like [Clupea harengus]
MMPFPQLWAVCFFIMLLLPGLDTQTAFVGSMVKYEPLTYNRTYVSPGWVHVLGWVMAFLSILMAPVVALFLLGTRKGNLKQC